MSAPVMAIRIAANLAELKKNLAEGKLQIETTTTAMNKLVASFRGDKLVQTANNVTAAIMQMGGAAKLSSEQQERAFRTITAAMEALERQGRGVPPAMRAIADELRGLQPPAEQGASALQRMSERASSIALGFISAQAVIGGVTAAYRTLSAGLADSVKAAGEAERAHAQVAAALRTQGNAVPSVIDAYQAYAEALQRTTVYQDDAVEAAQALLVTVGNVMPRDMKKALDATANLAAGLGKDLPDAAMLVAKAAEGNVSALSKAGIAIDETRLKSEGFGYVLDQVTAKFGGQADAIANTYDGRLQQLANSWNNIQESIGRAITTNATVVTLFAKLNDLLVTNTGELNQNSAAMRTISSIVLVVVRSIGALAGALDVANMIRAGFVIGLRGLGEGLAYAGQVAALAAQGVALFHGNLTLAGQAGDVYKSLGAAADELSRRNDATVQGTIDFGNAMMGIEATANNLAKELEATKGQIVKTATATATAAAETEAWTRRTVGLGAAAKSAAAEVAKLPQIDTRRLTLRINEMKARAGGTELKEDLPDLPASFNEKVRLPKMAVRGSSLDAAISPTLFQNMAGQLPTVLMNAFQGGGSPVKAVGSMVGAELGKSLVGDGTKGLGGWLTANLGKTLGGSLSAMMPGIGALMGPAISKLTSMVMNIGGPSQKEQAGRGLVADFEKSFGGFDKMMASVGEAYRAQGRSAQEAQADVKALMDAEKRGPAAVQQWLDKIKGVTGAYKERLAAIDSGVQGVTQAFQAAGGRIPESLKESIRTLQRMEGLTEDQKKALGSMLDEARPDFAALQQKAEGFGISLAGLGPKFAQGRIQDRAKELAGVIDDLQNAGGDMGGILLGMSDEISKLVQDSLQFGTSIPDNMKPFIENLAAAGKLTDSNGNAITDLTKLSFAGTPLEKGLQTLVDKVGQLIDRLNDVPRNIDVTTTLTTRSDNSGINGGADVPDPIYMANGGFGTVDRPTVFVAGEAGREQFAFSGANKSFDRMPGSTATVDISSLERRFDRLADRFDRMPDLFALKVRDHMIQRGRR